MWYGNDVDDGGGDASDKGYVSAGRAVDESGGAGDDIVIVTTQVTVMMMMIW